ncbi:M14 family metallopeptidase [Dyadobacter sp. LHD-138]|uniref:succinylglutamate desuccinylase/aspartoacylase family protein n=1 Tax=Dyadobacter sp. LHD-138 TaxID=3071413 RepID=UPI0027DECCFE|nr:M14 family metallopeptidase [Dyadobacter sp. LHD-138]MDQ6481007.1 M14 family metallopeptidase [Dyadobacter sp. LHD-138]
MSVNGEFIKYQKLSGGRPGPRLLLIAGVHGDEYEPMLAATALISELAEILSAGEVMVVPVVNSSAYLSQARCGADGLDLARTCPGKENGSITEQTAYHISKLIREADYLVDMHTGGLMYDILPLAGYMLHPSDDVLEKQRNMAMAFNLPIVWGTEPGPEGRTLSIARDAHIPAIYLEYGGGTGFRTQVVQAYKDGVVNLLKHLQMIDNQPDTLPLKGRYWLEDHRLDSGFLQGKMPSPTDGIFEKDVSIGDVVLRGQKWGSVINPVSGDYTPVYADMDGLAFLIRNIVKVNQGDSLGGILPVQQIAKTVIYE